MVFGWLSQSMELLSIGLFRIFIWHIFMNEWIKNKHWPFCKQCLPIPVCLCVSQVYLHCFRFCMPRQGNRFMKNITYLKKFDSTEMLISTKMWLHNKKTNHNCCIYNCIYKSYDVFNYLNYKIIPLRIAKRWYIISLRLLNSWVGR